MAGLVIRSAKKFFREVKSPGDAATFCWRMLVPADPHVRQLHGWVWGKLPRMELSQVIPGIERVSVEIHEAHKRILGATLTLEELAVLLAIVKFVGAKNIFELGTFDGSTTLNLAANTPPDAQILTLDLPPNWDGKLSLQTPKDYQNIDVRYVGQRFHNTVQAGKIRQLLGDSAAIDWSELPGPFDLVFIDACHYYDYVVKDTENALKHVGPGGLIVWHDYGSFKDVSDAVDETSEKIKVVAIAGTRLALGFPDRKI